MVSTLSFMLGLRFSRGHRRGMVSLISIISTLGIALGVVVLIVGLSAMNGFERELNNRILDVVPHGEIEPVNPPFTNWQQILRRVAQLPGVAAAEPYVSFTGLIESGSKLQAIQIKGVDPQQEMQFSTLPHYVADNAWQHFTAGRQQIILGQGVANKLKVLPGAWITIMVPTNNAGDTLPQPQRIRLQVSGILQLSGALDHTLALVPMEDAQHYLGLNGSVTGIAIKAKDPFRAREVVRAAGEATHTYIYIRSWIGTYGYMYRDIQMIRAIMYLAMVLVIGVACFNIVSTLVMAVKEKSSDIAVLRTLGARDSLISAIFVWYGLLAGLAGSVVGVIVGVLAALNLTSIINAIQTATGYHFLSGDVYFIDFLPTELHWWDVVVVLATSIVLSLIASWYPARRACRIDPVQILSRQ